MVINTWVSKVFSYQKKMEDNNIKSSMSRKKQKYDLM